MKNRVILSAVLLCYLSATSIPAQSIKFLRSLSFKNKSDKKNLKTFLFGRSRRPDIYPASISRVGADRVCITDALNGLVFLADNRGKIKQRIGRIKKYKLLSPVSVCSGEENKIYISDSGLNIIFQCQVNPPADLTSNLDISNLDVFQFCNFTGTTICSDI